MANEKILVVDDDKNICELLRLYLVKEGYNVTMVHDGGAALAEFDKLHPDLVLLDVMMPVMDGWEVCRKLRAKDNTPIIMLTAKGETYDKVLGLELGADDYIVKPFDAKEVTARIKAVLRRTGDGSFTAEEADYDEYEGESIDKQLYTLAMPNDISGDEIETAAITETGLYHSSEEKNYHQYTSYISESFSKVSKSLISSELQKIEKAYGVKVSASKVAKAMQTVFDKVKETEYEYSLYEKKTLEGDGYTEVITLSVDGAMYEDDSLSAYIYVDRDRVYK